MGQWVIDQMGRHCMGHVCHG